MRWGKRQLSHKKGQQRVLHGLYIIIQQIFLHAFAVQPPCSELDFLPGGNYTVSMNLKSILTTETINLHLKGSVKDEIINELLDILVAAGKIQNREAAHEAIMYREHKMSTGMKHGIAIPHGKSSTISDLVACIGISDKPIDFDSLDSEPSRIFIMTLSPVEKTGPHLQFLAEISLLFKSAEKRQEILGAQTPEAVIKILAE